MRVTPLIFLIFLFLSACDISNHHALGPVEIIKDDNFPRGMFDPTSDKRSYAETMVIWHLSSNLEETKYNPPDMLRGISYLEFVFNDIIHDYSVSVSTKENIQKIIFTLREALGIPVQINPSRAINILWSTAKFLDISEYRKENIDENILKGQKKISTVKSSLTSTLVKAKSNFIREYYIKILKNKGKDPLQFKDYNSIEFKKNRNSLGQSVSLRIGTAKMSTLSERLIKDLSEDMRSISQTFLQHEEYFESSKDSYTKDLFISSKSVFESIEGMNQYSWTTLINLKALSDFLAISTSKFVPSVRVVPKSNAEVVQQLRQLEFDEFDYVKEFLLYFKKQKKEQLIFLQKSYRREMNVLQPSIYHLKRHQIDLTDLIMNIEKISIQKITDITNILKGISGNISLLSSELNNIAKEFNDSTGISISTGEFSTLTSQLSYMAGQAMASLSLDLQSVANEISSAIQSGISVDLESMAAGLGFGSFAQAVAAYNAEYGTSYSVQQAKDALSGK